MVMFDISLEREWVILIPNLYHCMKLKLDCNVNGLAVKPPQEISRLVKILIRKLLGGLKCISNFTFTHKLL